MLTSINEVYDYIYSFINLEKGQKLNKKNKEAYTLENIINILKYFNNPQNNKKIIHIAGTKGKGSVTLMISSLLKNLDAAVCTFLSPHLVDINERFLYNLEEIKNDEIIKLTNDAKNILDKNNLVPTTFELLFIIFLLFAELKKPDYLVIEVGLGGRLDTTNIVDPILSVITPVSFDHMEILGKTIGEIASEKAGIIKEKTPVVTSIQKKEALKIIKNKASAQNAALYETEKSFKLLSEKYHHDGISFSFIFQNKLFEDIFLPLLGIHQITNFLTAFLSVHLINEKISGYISKEKRITVRIPGRIEVIKDNPKIIIDVAHNRDSAEKLKRTLKSHFPEIKKWNILSGMSIDKDYKGFYKELKNIAKRIIITTPSVFKESDPIAVFNSARKIFKNTVFINELDKALDESLSSNEPLLVTGSFYIAGPVLEKISNLKNY